MWTNLIKNYNLDHERQELCLHPSNLKWFKAYISCCKNKSFTYDYLFQEGTDDVSQYDILDNRNNTLFLQRLSLILSWFSISCQFIFLDTTDDVIKKDDPLPNELFNGQYFPKEKLSYSNITSGNFDPLVIFIHCDEKNKYTLYITKSVESEIEEIRCEFCHETKESTFQMLKCIYTSHKKWLDENNKCVICKRFIADENVGLQAHFKVFHKLALAQYELLKRVKKNLNENDEESLEEFLDKQEKGYKDFDIKNSDNLLKSVNTTRITIDMAYDFETFPLSLGNDDAVPYIVSISMKPNFYYIGNCTIEQEKFEKIICRRFEEILRHDHFIILEPEQNKVFCLDPLFKPTVNAYTSIDPRKLKRDITQLENDLITLPTGDINSFLEGGGEDNARTLMRTKSRVTHRLMSALRNFLIFLNGDFREQELYGDIEEVIVRLTAFNGSRFDHLFVEHYLKLVAPSHIKSFFKFRKIIQAKGQISKISLPLYNRKIDGKTRGKIKTTQIKFEIVDVSLMRAPNTLSNLLRDLKIKDLKFPMSNDGHDYMAKYCLELEPDLVCPYPVTNKIKKLLGCPDENFTQWEEEFNQCLIAHKTMWQNSIDIFKFSEYFYSYGIKDSISAYCLLPFMYKESVDYLKIIQDENMLDGLTMLDYFGIAISTSGLAFKIWHIDQKSFIQPKGIAAITIRESLIGGFCQPHVKGEIKSEEEFLFPDNQITQIDIVSMYANAQRSCYMAMGKCETGTPKVAKAIEYCNELLSVSLKINIGLAHYQPIFGYYILIPPQDLKDHCELGPVGVKIKMKYTTTIFGQRITKNVDNLSWCGIPRLQALTPQDALTMRNMGFYVRLLDTPEAIKRTVLFETFGDPMKKFNETHIKMKIKAKKDGNSSLEKTAKLLNNGMYGRTIMNPSSVEIQLVKSSHEITDLYHRQFKGEIEIMKIQPLTYKLLTKRNNGVESVVEDIYYQIKFKHAGISSGPIHIGAQILGHSHSIYFSMFMVLDPLFGLIPVKRRCPGNMYSDTDSWYPQNNLLKRHSKWKFGSFICESPENPFDNNKWCVVVEEKEPNGESNTRGIFLGKKNYCFTTFNRKKDKDLILVSKGQNIKSLSGQSFKTVLNHSIMSENEYTLAMRDKEKIETERLSFYRNLFVGPTEMPLRQTTLRRELKMNDTIMGRHDYFPHVTFSPYSITQIKPNKADDIIQEITIFDSLYLHPELICGRNKQLTPEIVYQLVNHCFLHEREETHPILKLIKSSPDKVPNVSNLHRFMIEDE